jgi:hypothetical protein
MNELEIIFKRQYDKLTKKTLAEFQDELATELAEDVARRAPVDTGAYKNSITVGSTSVKEDSITTRVYTDLKVGYGKWGGVPLGAWLEYGTGIEGENTNTIDHGYAYRQTPWVYFNESLNRFVFTRGSVARPHWKPAVEKMRANLKTRLKEKFG